MPYRILLYWPYLAAAAVVLATILTVVAFYANRRLGALVLAGLAVLLMTGGAITWRVRASGVQTTPPDFITDHQQELELSTAETREGREGRFVFHYPKDAFRFPEAAFEIRIRDNSRFPYVQEEWLQAFWVSFHWHGRAHELTPGPFTKTPFRGAGDLVFVWDAKVEHPAPNRYRYVGPLIGHYTNGQAFSGPVVAMTIEVQEDGVSQDEDEKE
jgi:hypothetical protein